MRNEYARKLLLAAKRNRYVAPVYESANRLYHRIGNRGSTRLDVLTIFRMFAPNSGGTYAMRAPLTIDAINQTIPLLAELATAVGGKAVETMSADDFAEARGSGAAEELAAAFNAFGSDKASSHDYFRVYASLLARHDRSEPLDIFEIGLGTNNPDVVSHMGISGRPGASLRAFARFLPRARLWGADVDRRILFEEDRIKTFHIDQTDPATFAALDQHLPDRLDLMIDDGLHSPHANLNSLNFFLSRLSRGGGAAVIEDIPKAAVELWRVVGSLLVPHYRPTLVKGRGAWMFVVEPPRPELTRP